MGTLPTEANVHLMSCYSAANQLVLYRATLDPQEKQGPDLNVPAVDYPEGGLFFGFQKK